jgi:outer membrane protein OmpA-like peptidoglycan-associated protein
MRGLIITFLAIFSLSNNAFSQVYEEYIIKTIDINDSRNNAGASFFKTNSLVFTLPKKDENINDTDFYFSTYSEDGVLFGTQLLDGNLNSYINEIDLVFTTDRKKVYFTRSYIDNNKKEHFDIYVADVSEDNHFFNIKSLPINYKNFSTASPSLSLDNKTLYFSSNRKESLGGFDIFKVSILENGKRFSKVTNLGPNVNTKGDEITPYVMGERLFFSSNGRKGLGGFDVYSINTNLEEKAENLGETLNSNKNDFGFIRKKHRNYGFLCSDRDGGEGGNDIYFFTVIKIDPPVVEEEEVVKEEVIENTANEIVENKYTEKDKQNNEEEVVAVNDNTNNIIDENNKKETKDEIVKDSQAAKINITKPDEIIVNNNKGDIDKTSSLTKEKVSVVTTSEIVKEPEYEEEIIYKEKTELAENVYDFQRREVYNTTKEEVGRIRKLRKALTKTERVCVDRIEKLDDIYFDLNKFNIRPDAQIQVNKAIRIMEKCPNLKFVASSFTDSRGSSEYNRKLSQRRADSVVAYILNNSTLPAERIIGVGYGESGLKNQCYNGVKCSEKEHQINRRTEIEVSIKK